MFFVWKIQCLPVQKSILRGYLTGFIAGDPSRHGESTGLGLAVVKVLTEKLGGEIAAGMREDVLWVRLVI